MLSTSAVSEECVDATTLIHTSSCSSETGMPLTRSSSPHHQKQDVCLIDDIQDPQKDSQSVSERRKKIADGFRQSILREMDGNDRCAESDQKVERILDFLQESMKTGLQPSMNERRGHTPTR